MNYLQPQLLNRRRTKIVATLGPASSEPAMIEKLIETGVNVFRLNFSHGDHETHRANYERVRAAADKLKEPVAVLGDLCGPKIRVGKFAGGKIELETGSTVTVTTRDVPGEPGLIPSQYDALAKDVRPGNRILLDDGLLELRVEKVTGTEIACHVVHGGVLKDKKGMNLPGVKVSAPALTEKDRRDGRFALELGVDYLALSFVRKAEEVYGLKGLLREAGCQAHVVAKIEKPEALEDIDEILEATDAIMIARGDLGVELAPETVPIAQHQLLRLARRKNRPVIVATQMLESMIERPRPTRAEVSDVSHAVFGGADAVMLSAETAAGAYPVESVKMMDYVARQVEALQFAESKFGTLVEHDDSPPPIPLHVAIARSTAQLARDLAVRTIVVLSKTGATASMMSDARPSAPILAIATDASACRRMNLLWGVVPVQITPEEFQAPGPVACRIARDCGLAKAGQFLLMISGVSSFARGTTPTVAVLKT